MDSVFVITQNPPQSLSEKEMVLSPPSFLNEVKACERKKGSSATVGPNYLRAIAEEIGRRYDKFFNPYRNVVPHDFAGRISSSDEDTAKTVHEMFQATYPVIYQKYYESILRARPFSIKVVYFLGAKEDAVVFKKLGISEISPDDVPAHLGIEPQAKPKQAAPAQKPQQQKTIATKNVSKTEEKPTPAAQASNSAVLEKLATLENAVEPKQVTKPQDLPQQTNITKQPKQTPRAEASKET